MKEIGEMLREAREKNGVSKEEAAEDLGLKVAQIDSLEEGNVRVFKDINYVKQLIKEYAKYLGLDADKIIENFNEFIFDYTSRIPMEKIEKAHKEKEKKKAEKQVASPYTSINYYKELPPAIYYGLILILILAISYFIYIMVVRGDVELAIFSLGGIAYELSE